MTPLELLEESISLLWTGWYKEIRAGASKWGCSHFTIMRQEPYSNHGEQRQMPKKTKHLVIR